MLSIPTNVSTAAPARAFAPARLSLPPNKREQIHRNKTSDILRLRSVARSFLEGRFFADARELSTKLIFGGCGGRAKHEPPKITPQSGVLAHVYLCDSQSRAGRSLGARRPATRFTLVRGLRRLPPERLKQPKNRHTLYIYSYSTLLSMGNIRNSDSMMWLRLASSRRMRSTVLSPAMVPSMPGQSRLSMGTEMALA